MLYTVPEITGIKKPYRFDRVDASVLKVFRLEEFIVLSQKNGFY